MFLVKNSFDSLEHICLHFQCFVLNVQRAVVFKCPFWNEELHRFFLLLVYWTYFYFYNDYKTIWSEINLPFKTNGFVHHCPIKVQVFLKRPQKFENISHLPILILMSKCHTKWEIFQILWPSHKVLTLLLPVLCCLKSAYRYLNLKSTNFLMQDYVFFLL